MKKFLMYVIIVVTCLFLGFTIYYLAQNKEKITMSISNDESIYINKGDSFALPIVWEDPYKDTKMTITVDSTLLNYDETTKMITGINGGFSSVTVTTTNKNFGPFIFEVYVGDGTVENPYAISGQKDNPYSITLSDIGKEKYPLDKSYMLIEDVEMGALEETVWTPFDELTGTFNGNGFTIHNLNITTGTNVGLFSSIGYSGMVENVKFANAKIEGSFDNAGVVAGVNKGTIGKCQIISATISNTNENGRTGTIVGANLFDTKPAIINMCSVDSASVSGAGIIGGLVGENIASIILNSRALIDNLNGTVEAAVVGGIAGQINSKYFEDADAFYYSHISKVYSVINTVEGSATIVGAVVGQNLSNYETNPLFVNKFDNILYDSSAKENFLAIGSSVYNLTDDVKNQFTVTDKENLLKASTYNNELKSFDLTNVWTIEDGVTYANINYNGNYESLRIIAVTTKIANERGFADFLTAIQQNPSLNEEFVITENLTIDIGELFGSTEWETIAPEVTKPLQTSIIVEDGVTCTITNFKLSGNNTSFFGYISGNSIIKGLTFGEKIVVENQNTNTSAVVATGVAAGGVLENITVTSADTLEGKVLTTPSRNVGIISATNNGTILNCNVASDTVLSLKVKASGQQGNIGGIVGFNQGFVSGCFVDMVKLEIDTSMSDASAFNVGGICGTTDSNISNCGVDGFSFETSNNGIMYVGGVVGYTTNASSISITKNYAVAVIKLNTGNSVAYLGGVIGYVSATTTVNLSSSDGATLKAHNVGGVAGINYGTVVANYSNSFIEGNKVAGLVTLNYKYLANCYTLSTLSGINDNSSVNGITAKVPEGSTIDKCFSSSTFQGSGRKYAESESTFRMYELFQNIVGVFNEEYKCGTVSNLIIINYGNAEVQTVIFGQKNFWWNETWVEATVEECKGSDGFSVFINAGYDSSVWNFTEVGSYPTLVGCASPIVEEEPEVTPESSPETPEESPVEE